MAVCPKCGQNVELDESLCNCGAGIAQFGDFNPYSPSPSVLGLDEHKTGAPKVELRPRYNIAFTFGDIIRATFQLWVRAFASAVVVLFLPLLIGSTIAAIPTYLTQLGLNVPPVPTIFRATLTYLFLSLAHVAVTSVFNDFALRGPSQQTYLHLFRKALSFWWRSFALYLLLGLVALAVSLVILADSLVAIAGVFMAIIAFYYLARWVVVVPIIVVENARLSTAIRRATSLVKGRSWTVFALIIVVSSLSFIPLQLLNWGLGQFVSFVPLNTALKTSILIFVPALLTAVFVSLAYALCLTIYGALRDLREEPITVTLNSAQTRSIAWSLAVHLHEHGIAAQVVERKPTHLPLVFFAQPFDVKILMADLQRGEELDNSWKQQHSGQITKKPPRNSK